MWVKYNANVAIQKKESTNKKINPRVDEYSYRVVIPQVYFREFRMLALRKWIGFLEVGEGRGRRIGYRIAKNHERNIFKSSYTPIHVSYSFLQNASNGVGAS